MVTTILRQKGRDVWQFLELPQVPKFQQLYILHPEQVQGVLRAAATTP
jgi:hypothetical protein